MAKNMLYNIKKAATYHYVVASWFNSFYYEQKQIECKDTDFFGYIQILRDIIRYFCQRKLCLVALPVSASPYVLRSVHIYKRLGRYFVILV